LKAVNSTKKTPKHFYSLLSTHPTSKGFCLSIHHGGSCRRYTSYSAVTPVDGIKSVIDIDVDNLINEIYPIWCAYDPRTPNTEEVPTSIIFNSFQAIRVCVGIFY
jgi:hypothetical protein